MDSLCTILAAELVEGVQTHPPTLKGMKVFFAYIQAAFVLINQWVTIKCIAGASTENLHPFEEPLYAINWRVYL